MQAIINEAKAYLERKNMSQAELAEKLGYTPAVLTQIFKKEYAGDTDQVLRKLSKEIGYTPDKWEILNTFNFQAGQNMCLDAQEGQRMMACYGDTGSGKTSTLQAYARKTVNSYYVLADVLMKPKDLLVTIQKAIGVDEAGTLSERLDSIVRKLESKNYPLLIIDDCGKLEEHSKCFGIIQLLFDRLENRCGIILAGTKRFAVYFNKMASKDVLGFRELKRRISYWQPFKDGVEKRFIAAVCTRQNITQQTAIDYISLHCTNYGDVAELIRNYNRYKTSKTVDENEQLQVLSSLKFSKL
jgi:plasmid maintenance system antidote protein VapI